MCMHTYTYIWSKLYRVCLRIYTAWADLIIRTSVTSLVTSFSEQTKRAKDAKIPQPNLLVGECLWLKKMIDEKYVRTEAIVAALYTLEPSCRRSGGACTAEGAHKTPRPSGWRLLRLKTGASSLHYSLWCSGFCLRRRAFVPPAEGLSHATKTSAYRANARCRSWDWRSEIVDFRGCASWNDVESCLKQAFNTKLKRDAPTQGQPWYP